MTKRDDYARNDDFRIAIATLRAWADRGEKLGQARVFDVLYLGPDIDLPTEFCWSVRVEEAHTSWSETSVECRTLVDAAALALEAAQVEGLT